jgi:hypothetical protein
MKINLNVRHLCKRGREERTKQRNSRGGWKGEYDESEREKSETSRRVREKGKGLNKSSLEKRHKK